MPAYYKVYDWEAIAVLLDYSVLRILGSSGARIRVVFSNLTARIRSELPFVDRS